VKIYAARAMTSYGTAHDRRQFDALARHFPSAELLDPAGMFTSNCDWLGRWPGVLAGLDVLAVFGDEHGYIGAGVLSEVAGAIAQGVPVVALDEEGGLRWFAGVECAGTGPLLSRSRTGQLLCGAPVSRRERDWLRHRPSGAQHACSPLGTQELASWGT
jgi:hypothetical protein